jgi:ribosome-associated protein
MSAEDAPDRHAADLPRTLRPSKTQRKLESHDLQALGAAVAEMSDERLAALPIPENLLEAVRDYKRTRSFEARRRQMQYVGKLMRTIDAQPLREAVAELQLGRARDALALHRAEHWRAELLADDAALTRWAAEHEAADLQQLRSLVRSARTDAALAPERRSGRAARELFRFIREHNHDE